jgi:hypothetical protein
VSMTATFSPAQVEALPQLRGADQRHTRFEIGVMLDEAVDALDPRQTGDLAQPAGVDMHRDTIIDALRAVDDGRAHAGERSKQALLRLLDTRELRLCVVGRLERRAAFQGSGINLSRGRGVELDHDPGQAAASNQRGVDFIIRFRPFTLTERLLCGQPVPAGGLDARPVGLLGLHGEWEEGNSHEQECVPKKSASNHCLCSSLLSRFTIPYVPAAAQMETPMFSPHSFLAIIPKYAIAMRQQPSCAFGAGIRGRVRGQASGSRKPCAHGRKPRWEAHELGARSRAA